MRYEWSTMADGHVGELGWFESPEAALARAVERAGVWHADSYGSDIPVRVYGDDGAVVSGVARIPGRMGHRLVPGRGAGTLVWERL